MLKFSSSMAFFYGWFRCSIGLNGKIQTNPMDPMDPSKGGHSLICNQYQAYTPNYSSLLYVFVTNQVVTSAPLTCACN